MAVSSEGAAYDLAGPDGAPGVVLIHGLGLNRAVTWDAILPALTERYRVLRYDLPGHGDSAAVAGEISLSSLAGGLVRLMDEAGMARATLVGFSLGGMINRRAALDHPGRVTALGILNAPHERGPEAQRLYEAAARDSAAGGPEATVDAALARWFTDGFRAAAPETVAQVRGIVTGTDPASYAAHRRVLAEGVTGLVRPVPPLEVPGLVMTCEHDSGSTPAMGWAIAGELPEAEVVIVPELRHLGLLERPDVFAGAVRGFLDACRQKAES